METVDENRDNDIDIEESGEVDTLSALTSPDTFDELVRILEALLFAASEVLSAAHLKTLMPGEPDARAIRKMVEAINVNLQKQHHPFEVAEIAGGYQMRTVSYYYPWIRKLFKEKSMKRLSVQALECLAIISYKQPITKAEIESIRGVISDGAMKTLLERHLVTISGRSDKPGKPLLYATTREFLTYFGINRIADLPSIEEFEVMAREKMKEMGEDLSTEDLQKELDPEPETIDEESVAADLVEAGIEDLEQPIIADVAGPEEIDNEELPAEEPGDELEKSDS